MNHEHSEPVDMNAVRVTRFGGEKYMIGAKKIVCFQGIAPPKLRAVPVCTPNLTGVRFGRFTVIGLSAKLVGEAAGKPAMWAVRCDCGNYAKRTSKAVKNPANSVDRCETCRQVVYEERRFSRGR